MAMLRSFTILNRFSRTVQEDLNQSILPFGSQTIQTLFTFCRLRLCQTPLLQRPPQVAFERFLQKTMSISSATSQATDSNWKNHVL